MKKDRKKKRQKEPESKENEQVVPGEKTPVIEKRPGNSLVYIIIAVLVIIAVLALFSRAPVRDTNSKSSESDRQVLAEIDLRLRKINTPGNDSEVTGDELRIARRDRFFNRGLTFYNEKSYDRALYYFHQAEALDKNDPEIKYYLVKLYSLTEESPGSPDSKTLRYAVELQALDRDGRFSSITGKYLDGEIPVNTTEYDRIETGETLNGKDGDNLVLAAETQSQEQEPVKISQNSKPPLPVIPDESDYPKADAAKNRKTQKPETAQDIEVSGSGMQTVTLKGRVVRPDENGRLFKASGVEMRLEHLGGSESYTAVTDVDGYYAFENVQPADNYVLAAVSVYKYTEQVYEYYRYPRYKNPYTVYNDGGSSYGSSSYYSKSSKLERKSGNRQYKDRGGVDARLMYEPETGKITGSGSYYPQPTRIYAGDSVYYYPPNYNVYGYYDREYTRNVTQSSGMSWHFRINLSDPGLYKLELNPQNADSNFVNQLKPQYDPISREPFKEIRRAAPEKL